MILDIILKPEVYIQSKAYLPSNTILTCYHVADEIETNVNNVATGINGVFNVRKDNKHDTIGRSCLSMSA